MTPFIICLLVYAASGAVVNRDTGTTSNGLSCDFRSKEHNGWCYLFSKDADYFKKGDHSGANFVCKLTGSDLASVHNSDESGFLRQNDPTALIGLSYDEGKLQWSDGSPLDYKNLTSNFLDMADSLGYCAIIGRSNWENAKCDGKTYTYICKKRPSEFPSTGCPDSNHIRYDGGQLSSPGYPFAYYGPGDCIWKLAVRNGMRIEIKIKDLLLVGERTLDVYEGWNRQVQMAHLTSNDSGTHPFYRTEKLNRILIVLTKPNGTEFFWTADWTSINGMA